MESSLGARTGAAISLPHSVGDEHEVGKCFSPWTLTALAAYTGASDLSLRHMEIWRACMSRHKHAYWSSTQMNACVPWVCPGDLRRDSEPSSRLWFLAATRLSPSTPGLICLFLALVPARRRPPLLPTKRPGVGGAGAGQGWPGAHG